MLQAKVVAVYYLHDWSHPDPVHKAEYERLQTAFTGGIRRISVEDPEAAWAIGRQRPSTSVEVREKVPSEDQHGTQDQ